MNLVSIVFGSIFTVTGVLFGKGKLHPYISAWKAMPPEEKEQVNIEALCQNIGELIFLSGLIFLLNGFWEGFRQHWFTGTMIAWMVVAGLDVWFISKSDRYKNKSSVQQGR